MDSSGEIPIGWEDSSWGGGNVLVGKMDTNFNLLWVKVYGGTGQDYGCSAVATPDGGFALLCYTSSNDRDVTGNHGYHVGDYWLIRLDSIGNLSWQKCFGSPYDELPFSIALTTDNGFILAGTNPGSGGDVPYHYGGNFSLDWFVVKTDSIGNLNWSRDFGGTADEGEHGSILAQDGVYYLASFSSSTDHDCIDTCWHPNKVTAPDLYLLCIDTAGNIIWDSSYGGSGADGCFAAIWDPRDSTIVVNGVTTSDDYMVSGYYGAAGGDMWAIKIKNNGKFLWQRCMGEVNQDGGENLCLSDAGYILFGVASRNNIGMQDALLFSLNTNGDTLNSLIFGSSGYDYPYGNVINFNRGFLCSGFTYLDDFDVGENDYRIAGANEYSFMSYFQYWPLGIPERVKNSDLIVSPTPTSKELSIETSYHGLLLITDCLGKQWLTRNNFTGGVIEVSNWPAGVYLISIQTDDGNCLKDKFIVY